MASSLFITYNSEICRELNPDSILFLNKHVKSSLCLEKWNENVHVSSAVFLQVDFGEYVLVHI